MYIQVKLLNGYHQFLWYKIPKDWTQQSFIGSILRVPLKKQIISAFVVQESECKPSVSFAIKEVIGIETLPSDPYYLAFINQLSAYYQLEPIYFMQRIQHFITQKAYDNDIVFEKKECISSQIITLTEEQQQVCNFLTPYITCQQYQPTVVHGVTGSGKTEIYKRIMTHALTLNKSSLFLLPEVTLAIEFERRLKYELGAHIPLFGFHSGTTPKQKKEVWNKLLKQESMIIIGVHLPVLLPISNLGLIIVDEEHEVGYQEKKHPKINSKEAALMRAKIYNIPILLGSATPSVATLHNVKTRNWKFFQLKNRFSGSFAKISTVLLTDKKERKSFWISMPLMRAIKERLEKKEQTILFINRRGFSFFMQCKECSFIFCCRNCSVSLTLHDNGMLVCHYCGLSMIAPSACAGCNAHNDSLLKKGIGTQQVVSIVQKLFPTARIARADLDTTARKKEWQQTLASFTAGDIDILVGTQTITKGYHFPNVTLVGIIWADLNLNFPLYNASETTLQQLIQVAGRAGRERLKSEVIVQCMGEHSIFSYLNEIDYLCFFESEMSIRTEVGYPPFTRLAQIELKHTDEVIVEKEAAHCVQLLIKYCLDKNLKVIVLGPAKPPVAMIQHTHMQKIYLKSHDISSIIQAYQALAKIKFTSSIFFTPNPMT
jgi:primosomal protein N' (replication factor Y)